VSTFERTIISIIRESVPQKSALSSECSTLRTVTRGQRQRIENRENGGKNGQETVWKRMAKKRQRLYKASCKSLSLKL